VNSGFNQRYNIYVFKYWQLTCQFLTWWSPDLVHFRQWQLRTNYGSAYTPCLKKVPPSTCYIHNPITTFLAEVLLRKYEIIWCFVFQLHLSSAFALPCETGNPEDSALVHCACNTVQLMQRYRLLFTWNMPPNSPYSAVHWLQDLGSHTAAWVWVVSQKHCRNQAAGWIQAMH